jgi:hypothetical protein
MVFSLLCFAAIICILGVFEGKARPHFAYGLTLNAIASVLATASKSSLIYVIGECIGQLKWIWFYKKRRRLDQIQLFDSVSRGPLGSLFMLMHFISKTPNNAPLDFAPEHTTSPCPTELRHSTSRPQTTESGLSIPSLQPIPCL